MIKLNLSPDDRLLRQFAWVSPIGFAAIAFLLHKALGLPTPWSFAVAGIGVLVLAADLLGLRAFTRLWFRALVLLTFPIGLVLFPLLIGLIYYLVFTPMGLLFRAIGRDALHLRSNRDAKSYWLERGPARPASSYFKLY